MSTAFPNTLRAGRPPIAVGQPGSGAITFRVGSAELWDAVRVTASRETPVSEIKRRALASFFPNDQYLHEYILKFRGWEMLDESASLADVGITDGSILLLAVRRRQAVR